MARYIRCETLTQLQSQMTRLETAIEPADVKPILAKALEPVYNTALANLRRLVKTGGVLRLPDQKHIEEVLKITEGKSPSRASAWLRVWRKFAPQGVWIEAGHVLWRGGVRRKGRGKQIGKVEAKPFFAPAVRMERKNVESRVESGLKALIARFVTRY